MAEAKLKISCTNVILWHKTFQHIQEQHNLSVAGCLCTLNERLGPYLLLLSKAGNASA